MIAAEMRGVRSPQSPYRGVSWNHSSKCWRARLNWRKHCYELGDFKSEKDAARAYDRKALELQGKRARLNFPAVADKRCSRRPRSMYRGVYWYERENRWAADLMHQGTRYRLGRFAEEAEAARAYDRKAVELCGDQAIVNFPEEWKQLGLEIHTIAAVLTSVERPEHDLRAVIDIADESRFLVWELNGRGQCHVTSVIECTCEELIRWGQWRECVHVAFVHKILARGISAINPVSIHEVW